MAYYIGRRVGVYKPAASGCASDVRGCLVSDDAVALWEAAGRPGDLEHVCPQRFAAPWPRTWPPEPKAEKSTPICCARGWTIGPRCDIVLVEGAGGLMSPLGDNQYVADLAGDLGFPLIVVSRNILGTINATLQTLIAASVYGHGLEVAGVVLNHPSPPPAGRSQSGHQPCGTCRPLHGAAAGCRGVRAEQFDAEVDWFRAGEVT